MYRAIIHEGSAGVLCEVGYTESQGSFTLAGSGRLLQLSRTGTLTSRSDRDHLAWWGKLSRRRKKNYVAEFPYWNARLSGSRERVLWRLRANRIKKPATRLSEFKVNFSFCKCHYSSDMITLNQWQFKWYFQQFRYSCLCLLCQNRVLWNKYFSVYWHDSMSNKSRIFFNRVIFLLKKGIQNLNKCEKFLNVLCSFSWYQKLCLVSNWDLNTQNGKIKNDSVLNRYTLIIH